MCRALKSRAALSAVEHTASIYKVLGASHLASNLTQHFVRKRQRADEQFLFSRMLAVEYRAVSVLVVVGWIGLTRRRANQV